MDGRFFTRCRSQSLLRGFPLVSATLVLAKKPERVHVGFESNLCKMGTYSLQYFLLTLSKDHLHPEIVVMH